MEGLLLPIGAVIAGFVSFSSPCCLPLIPGYLSYVSALPVSELGQAEARRVTIRASLLFVAGFTTVFVALGVGATAFGSLLLRNQDTVVRWFGVVIIVLSLSTMGAVRIPALLREKRVDMGRLPRGPAWAIPWEWRSPPDGRPALGRSSPRSLLPRRVGGTAGWGAVLLGLYSLGLGIPFVLLAVGFSRAQGSLSWLRRHGRRIELFGGALLVGVGVLFVTGRWQPMFRPLQRWFAEFGWPPI